MRAPSTARARDGRRPVLIIVGDAETMGAKLPRRLIDFSETLYIGRHAPKDEAAAVSAWVVSDRLISSQHALITESKRGYQLVDTKSTNGTFVDGERVRGTAPLEDRSVVFIGNHVVVLRIVTPAERAALQAEQDAPFGPVGTACPELALVCQQLRLLAKSEAELLLVGETGTGKEVYAQAIHKASGRSGRFVAINCAALPRELVESELFGYKRGAHSQATDSKVGLIEAAERGTLFLDEIGEMPPELQAKMLRFVQDRHVTPLGATVGRVVDTRIIAATNRATSSGRSGLRHDLFARLGAEPIVLPALRDRIEDVGVLAGHFLGRRRPFEASALQALCLYRWPGNVRELRKVIENADVLARRTDTIAREHLPKAMAATFGRTTTPTRAQAQSRTTTPVPAPEGDAGAGEDTTAETAPPAPPSREDLVALLRHHKGKVMHVARALKRQPMQIYRWVRKHGLDPDAFRDGDGDGNGNGNGS